MNRSRQELARYSLAVGRGAGGLCAKDGSSAWEMPPAIGPWQGGDRSPGPGFCYWRSRRYCSARGPVHPGYFFEGSAPPRASSHGPYNEHRVRNIGSLQLGMAVVAPTAFLHPFLALVRTAALSPVAWQAPHAVCPLLHVADLPSADRVSMR